MLSDYKKLTLNSLTLYNIASRIMPYGVSSNYRYFEPYPLYLSRGKGSRVWDVDGNEYIDFNMAYGALGIGHSNPKLVKILKEKLENGTILGFEFADTLKLAKIIKSRFNVDMVRFSSTGTEATMHSIRIARAYTRKKKIIKFEGHYHGSHDQLLVNVSPEKNEVMKKSISSYGIPYDVVKNTLIAEWNNYESVEKLVKKEDVAAIIMEPIAMNMGLIKPDVSFLKGIFSLAKEYGFLIIFDEVKTGGKFYSGASGYYGLKPDLITLSKAIAGGLPLSVIAGKKEVMRVVGPNKTAHGGTFSANPLSVTASIVTLTQILTENSLYEAYKLNSMLSKGYQDFADDLDLDLTVSMWGTSGSIFFSKVLPKNYREFSEIDQRPWYKYFWLMLSNGIIPMADYDEQWTISTQHTKEDIMKHLEIAENILKKVKEEFKYR
ncbi:aspartate aminotransferase family protein [Acidianus manzaensis]|uniref:Aspartate aminotransferase family protein n=1 Tax=Acidianus manzaensis TaxID=282676 RepID=A0A1W6JYR7_9CREN|nr:aspartate aminotransferase family protein [Acidianus manzaensis]ARM75416.1 aspartate aminotransferase family protein [Acidianus manzaensis]